MYKNAPKYQWFLKFKNGYRDVQLVHVQYVCTYFHRRVIVLTCPYNTFTLTGLGNNHN